MPASATPGMIVSRSEDRRSTVCVYSLIVERLADGILAVKHGVAAFIVQFLECYFNHNAATCCYLVDRVLVVRDCTELTFRQLRFSGSSFRRKKKQKHILLIIRRYQKKRGQKSVRLCLIALAHIFSCWFGLTRSTELQSNRTQSVVAQDSSP